MQSMKQAALDYAAEGFHVIPCRRDKAPYTPNGLNAATTDPKQIEEWWTRWPDANIGFVPGKSNLMVLDLDPGHDAMQLQQAVGGLPYTAMEVRTPRGGKHLYFSLEPNEYVGPSASKVAPHVDVRSSASYVLLPPSSTDAGNYEWAGLGDPGPRSEELLAAVTASTREKSATREEWLIEPDLPAHVTKAIEWLKHEAKPAVEGATDQTTTAYATAAMLRSFGISPEKALDLMLEYWNPRCQPPWGEDAQEHFTSRINNAYRYSTSDPGNMTDAYHEARKAVQFKPIAAVLPSGQEVTAGRFRGVDWAGMDHIQPVQWLVKGLLPADSYAILFAPFGAFKTFVALDLALTIASGITRESSPRALWADALTDEGVGPVLFAAGEGRSGITKRTRAWAATHIGGDSVPGFVLMDPVPLISEELEPFLNVAKAFHPQYKLAVIDTVGRSMQGADENAQKEASRFTALVDRLRQELGCTVLALHHTGHGDTGRERGSTVFGADADTRIKLDREDKEYEVTLSVVKQKEDEEAAPLKVSLIKHQFSADNSTLVAVKHEHVAKSGQASKPERVKFDPYKNKDGEALQKLDEVVKRVMMSYSLKQFSQKELAEHVAMQDDVEIGSNRIRNLLTTLRETKGTFTHGHYFMAGPRPYYLWRPV